MLMIWLILGLVFYHIWAKEKERNPKSQIVLFLFAAYIIGCILLAYNHT